MCKRLSLRIRNKQITEPSVYNFSYRPTAARFNYKDFLETKARYCSYKRSVVCAPSRAQRFIYVTLSRVSKLQLTKWQEAPEEERRMQQHLRKINSINKCKAEMFAHTSKSIIRLLPLEHVAAFARAGGYLLFTNQVLGKLFVRITRCGEFSTQDTLNYM